MTDHDEKIYPIEIDKMDSVERTEMLQELIRGIQEGRVTCFSRELDEQLGGVFQWVHDLKPGVNIAGLPHKAFLLAYTVRQAARNGRRFFIATEVKEGGVYGMGLSEDPRTTLREVGI